MPVFSKLKMSPRTGVAVAASATALAIYYVSKYHKKTDSSKNEAIFAKNTARGAGDKKSRVAVDRVFLQRLLKLLKICVPGPLSKEALLLFLVALLMVARTYCDLWMLQNGTAVEARIIGRDKRGFCKELALFIAAMLPISLVNQGLKYGLNELALCFRVRLSKHLYDKYMRGFTFYQISNLDNRISNPDQLLTQDLDKFCNSLADLYSNLSKPILDMVVYSVKLARSHGAKGPGSMLGYLALSGVFLTSLRRPLGRFTVREQSLEGDFRYVNSRLITNSEEIAFYGGNFREKWVLDTAFKRLVNQLSTSINFRFSMGVIDNIVAKYMATTVGYFIVSGPFLDDNNHSFDSMEHGAIMQEYYKSGRMLLHLAQAVGRLVLAGRELTRLAGFTYRVDELGTVLDELNAGKYVRTMVNKSDKGPSASRDLIPGSGKIVEKDYVIQFEDVPLVTPNGDVLVESLTIEVPSGRNVLICGPNGCGKSSLFRILGELWPMFGGTLTKPRKNQLFYVPQRPYLTLGSFRDQLIYPHTYEQYQRTGTKDETLLGFLKVVGLSHVLEREGGFESIQDWQDVLSGGEKQRVAMARLFYHKPQFAILDECTSAVSQDSEARMYEYCRTEQITLFTVSHRKTLWRHHEYKLEFDGRGTIVYAPITDEEYEYYSKV